jgi:hypothetical protein
VGPGDYPGGAVDRFRESGQADSGHRWFVCTICICGFRSIPIPSRPGHSLAMAVPLCLRAARVRPRGAKKDRGDQTPEARRKAGRNCTSKARRKKHRNLRKHQTQPRSRTPSPISIARDYIDEPGSKGIVTEARNYKAHAPNGRIPYLEHIKLQWKYASTQHAQSTLTFHAKGRTRACSSSSGCCGPGVPVWQGLGS